MRILARLLVLFSVATAAYLAAGCSTTMPVVSKVGSSAMEASASAPTTEVVDLVASRFTANSTAVATGIDQTGASTGTYLRQEFAMPGLESVGASLAVTELLPVVQPAYDRNDLPVLGQAWWTGEYVVVMRTPDNSFMSCFILKKIGTNWTYEVDGRLVTRLNDALRVIRSEVTRTGQVSIVTGWGERSTWAVTRSDNGTETAVLVDVNPMMNAQVGSTLGSLVRGKVYDSRTVLSAR